MPIGDERAEVVRKRAKPMDPKIPLLTITLAEGAPAGLEYDAGMRALACAVPTLAILVAACHPPAASVGSRPTDGTGSAVVAPPPATPASATAVAPSGSSTASATASGADSGAPRAQPQAADAPPCPPAKTYPPVSAVTLRLTRSPIAVLNRLQLATPDAALAPSLMAVQRAMNGWLDQRLAEADRPPDPAADPVPCFAGECQPYRGGCSVIRNDGEFLSTHCTMVPVMAARYAATKTFTARRTAAGYALQSVKELFPSSPQQPVDDLLRQRCDEGEELGWWHLRATDMQLHFQALHPSGGNCWLPLETLRPWHGCSTLSTSVTTDGEATDAFKPPLSFATGTLDGHNPYSDMLFVWTGYAARAAVAGRIRQDIQRFVATIAAADKEPTSNCFVGVSTGSVFSAGCMGSGEQVMSVSYRLADGAPIESAKLLRKRNASARIAKRCLGAYVGGGEGRSLSKLPTLTANDLRHFVLNQTGATFLLRVRFDKFAEPLSETCFVPYGALGTSLFLVSRP